MAKRGRPDETDHDDMPPPPPQSRPRRTGGAGGAGAGSLLLSQQALGTHDAGAFDDGDAFDDCPSGDETDLVMEDDEPAQRSLAGTLIKIHLENFMCHKNLTIEFTPDVNIINGANGSGKSAVCAALMMVLGSKASKTSRGSNAKGIIRHGAVGSARIVATFNNVGKEGFRPSVFGPRLIIERVISQSGASTYNLRHGTTERTLAKGISEVRAFCEHMNMDPDNPMCVLTQEEAKKFMFGNSQDMYRWFLKATMMSTLRCQYDAAQGNNQNIGRHLDSAYHARDTTKAAFRRAEERYKDVGAYDKTVLELKQVEQDVLWLDAKTRETAVELNEQALLEVEEVKIPALQKALDDAKAEAAKHEQAYTDFAEHAAQRIQAAEAFTGRIAAARSKVTAAKATVHKREAEVVAAKNAVKQHRRKVAKAQAEVDRVTQQLAQDDSNREAAEHAKRLESLTQQVELATAEMQELSVQNSRIEDEFQAATDNLNRAKAESTRASRAATEAASELRAAGSGGNTNPLAAFEPDVQKFYRALHQQGGLHECLGPIGMHVKLKPEFQKWAGAVQSVAAFFWSKFLVRSRDLAKYNALSRKLRVRINFIVYNRDNTKLSLGSPSITTAMDACQFANDWVFNACLEWGDLARNALCESKEFFESRVRVGAAGRFTMRDGVKQGVLPDGAKLRARGGQTSRIAGGYQGRLKLNVDQSTMVGELKVRAAKAKEEATAAKAALNAADNTRRGVQTQRTRISRKLNALRKRKADLTSALAEEQEFEPQDKASDLQAELEDSIAVKNALVDEMSTLVDAVKAAEDNVAPAEALVEPLAKAVQDLIDEQTRMMANDDEEDQLNLQNNVDKARRAVLVAQTKLDKKKHALAEAQRDSAKHRQEAKAALKQAMALAKESGLDMNMPEDLAERLIGKGRDDFANLSAFSHAMCKAMTKLNKTCRNLRKRADVQKQNLGDINEDEIRTEYHLLRDELSRQEDSIARAEMVLQLLSKSVDKREKKFDNFLRNISSTARQTFKGKMGEAGHKGDVVLNHETKQLDFDIVTNYDKGGNSGTTGSAGEMSGGERSYTLSSMVSAMAAVSNSPFRFIDELDIYMDAQARTRAMKTQVTDALNNETQLILLTPLDASMFHKMALGGKKRKKLNVSVHTLEAPERGGAGSDDE